MPHAVQPAGCTRGGSRFAAPFVLLFAALSWHFVEWPVLTWCRGRLARLQAPRGADIAVGDQAAR